MWWWTSFLFKNHLSKVHRDDAALGWVNLPQSTLNCRLMCVKQSRWCWERVNPIEVPQIDDYSVTYIRDYTGSVIIALHHSIEFHFQVQPRNSWAGDWARVREKLFFRFSRVLLGVHHAATIRYFLTISGENRIINRRDCRWTATAGVRNGTQNLSASRADSVDAESLRIRGKRCGRLCFWNRGRDCHDAIASRRRQCTTEPHIN